MKDIVRSEKVAARVRAELDRQQIPASAIAECLGLSEVRLQRRLTGEVGFYLTQLGDIAEILGVPIVSFFRDSLHLALPDAPKTRRAT